MTCRVIITDRIKFILDCFKFTLKGGKFNDQLPMFGLKFLYAVYVRGRDHFFNHLYRFDI